MSKQSGPLPQFKPQDLSDEWLNHPWIEWLIAKRHYLLWGFIGLFAVLLLSYRFLSIRTLKAENDYFQAQNEFNQFQQLSQDASVRQTHLQNLIAIMKRRPELHAKYDGLLAQLFIIEKQIPEAETFAQSTFKRVKPDQLALYESYAKTSLLISQGSYVEALQQALNLQSELTEHMGQEASKSILYAFNQIRLATLYQQLGDKEKEFAAWETIQKQLNRPVKALVATENLFKAGQTSLNDYVEERKKS